MKIEGNTVFIAGGSSGIGFEIAKIFIKNSNKVIISGRNQDKLEAAKKLLPELHLMKCDVSKVEEITILTGQLIAAYPNLNIVINNAALAFNYNLAQSKDAYLKAEAEIETNYLAAVNLNELLLPHLHKQDYAAIVNVTSIVAYLPNPVAPSYSASKAALHAYTLCLRTAVAHLGMKVFELMPSTVNTPFSKDRNGKNGLSPADVALALLDGLADDRVEIHVGKSWAVLQQFLKKPSLSLFSLIIKYRSGLFKR